MVTATNSIEIITCLGTDAGVAFDDIGHSTSARKQLESFYIGELVEVCMINGQTPTKYSNRHQTQDGPQRKRLMTSAPYNKTCKLRCCRGSSAIFFAAAAGLAIVAAAFIYQRTHYTA